MTDPELKLAELGLTLPPAPSPVAAYIPFRRSGNLVFVAGQVPFRPSAEPGGKPQLIATGPVEGLDCETIGACARQCVLNGLAVVKGAAGSLSKITQVVRLGVFVACGPEFKDHPKVANGASELLVQVFGPRGQHARAAVGAPSLPLGAPIEVEFTFEVE